MKKNIINLLRFLSWKFNCKINNNDKFKNNNWIILIQNYYKEKENYNILENRNENEKIFKINNKNNEEDKKSE